MAKTRNQQRKSRIKKNVDCLGDHYFYKHETKKKKKEEKLSWEFY